MKALVLLLLAASAAASSPIELPADLPADVAAQARRILERRFRVTWIVARFEALPTDAASVLERPVLDAEAQETVLRWIRSGGLRVERVATASGRAGEDLSVTSGGRRLVVPERDIESAEGAVVVFPRTRALETGLRASARLGVVAGRGVRVAFDLILADDPVVKTVDDTGGEVDRVAGPAIRARGALRLATGEVAPILFEKKDGPGVLILLRLDGPDEDLPALIDLDSGVTLAVGGHLVDGAVREPAWEQAYDRDLEDERTPDPDVSLDTHWEDILERVGHSDLWWDLPGGLRVGRLGPSIREALAETLAAGAVLRGRREVLEVLRSGRDRIRLPLGPGEPFELFFGVRRSVRGETSVGSGCQDCSAAVAGTELTQEGLGLAGRAGVDGTVDVSLIAREVLASEFRVFSMLRVVSGYRSSERIPVRLPLVTDAILRVRAALPPGGGALPGNVHVTWTGGDAAALSVPEEFEIDEADLGPPVGGRGFLVPRSDPRALRDRVHPVPLEVAGMPLSLRPGTRGTLGNVRRRSRVTSWRSEGWCGMRIRHPVRSQPPHWFRTDDEGRPRDPLEGTYLRLRLRLGPHGPEIDVAGEIGGPPDDPVAFDPGDGPVEIVRHPRLVVAVAGLPLGGGGVLARGAGLVLMVRRPGIVPGFGPHRLVVCRRPDGETLLRTGSTGAVEAGGVTLLPTGIGGYASNHVMGEATTEFSRVRDGVRLAWLDEVETPTLTLEILAPPKWREVPVRTVITPTRPGNVLRTLVIGRSTTRRIFFPEPGRGLRAASVAGSPLTWEIEAGGDS